MRLKLILSAIAIFCFWVALPAIAVSVETNFDPNLAFVRYSMPLSGSLYYSDPQGFLRCDVQRKIGTAAAPSVGFYCIPLDQRYYIPKDVNDVNVEADYYVGFDFWYDSASSGIASAQIGLFNSDSNNVTAVNYLMNSVAVTPYGGGGGDTFALESQTNVIGTNVYSQTSYNISEFIIGKSTSYRCRMLIHSSGGQIRVDYDVNSIDSLGNEADVGSVSDILLADGTKQSAGMNAIGIRNAYATSITNRSIFRVDNMYFSTTGFQSMSVPSWLAPNDQNDFLASAATFTTGFRPWPDANHPSGNGVWQIKGGGGTGIHNDVNAFDTGLYPPEGYPTEDGKGYGFTRIRRKAEWGLDAAFYQPLNARYYLPFDDGAGYKLQTTDEFWMGWDYKWMNGNAAICQVFGLFNRNSSNAGVPGQTIYNYQNYFGLAIYNGVVDFVLKGNSNWGVLYPSGAVGQPDAFNMGFLSDTTSWYRIKFHYYLNAGTPTIEVKAYKFDSTGTLSATPDVNTIYAITDTAVKFYEGMNAFGIRNFQTSTPLSTTRNDFNFDNAYFSTEGPVEQLGKPSAFALNRADGNVDSKVDLKDFASFAEDWQSTTNLFWDMTLTTDPQLFDGKVDFKDLAIFAGYWLSM